MEFLGTAISSVDGDITITGNSASEVGVFLDSSSTAISTGTLVGTIQFDGTTTAAGGFEGVVLGSDITTINGDVSIVGDAVSGPGVSLGSGMLIDATGTGSVSIVDFGTDIQIGNGSGTATISTASGTVSTDSGRDTFINAGSSISADGGFSALSPVGSFTMVDSATIDSASSSVDIDVITDITLGQITAATDVSLTSSGDIIQLSGASLNASGAINFNQSGDLIVNGTIDRGYTLNPGTALRGIGELLGPVTAPDTTTVAPGNSPGILQTGDFDLQAGATLEFEFGGPLAGNSSDNHDQVQVTGTVTLAGDATFERSNEFDPSVGDVYTIIDNDGADPVVGTFNGLPEGCDSAELFRFGIGRRDHL